MWTLPRRINTLSDSRTYSSVPRSRKAENRGRLRPTLSCKFGNGRQVTLVGIGAMVHEPHPRGHPDIKANLSRPLAKHIVFGQVAAVVDQIEEEGGDLTCPSEPRQASMIGRIPQFWICGPEPIKDRALDHHEARATLTHWNEFAEFVRSIVREADSIVAAVLGQRRWLILCFSRRRGELDLSQAICFLG